MVGVVGSDGIGREKWVVVGIGGCCVRGGEW